MNPDIDIVKGGAVVIGIVAILVAIRPLIAMFDKRRHGTNGGSETDGGVRSRLDKIDNSIAMLDRALRDHRAIHQGEISDLRDLLVDINTSLKVALAVQQQRQD